jgi:hypothetical protein
MLLVRWQSRSLHFPLDHSVCAFSGACTAVMLVVVEVVLVDVGVVLVFEMAFVVVVVVVFGVGVVVGLVAVLLMVVAVAVGCVAAICSTVIVSSCLLLLGRWTCLVRSTSVRVVL